MIMEEKSVYIPNEEVRKEFMRAVAAGKHTEIANLIRNSDQLLDSYLKIEELPSGHSYADVVFLPRKASSLPILLIELKWDKTEQGAIEQIKRKDYPQILKGFGGPILLVGINYDAKSKKHTCKIEKMNVALKQ